MPNNYPSTEIKELFKVILMLKTEKEAENFFRDLLTLSEIKEFANRWQIIKLLCQGKSYLNIANKLKVSTTTVTRVAHWLHHGTGGYLSIAKKMKLINKSEIL